MGFNSGLKGLNRAKVVVCSEIHAKHINAVWAERTVFEC